MAAAPAPPLAHTRFHRHVRRVRNANTNFASTHPLRAFAGTYVEYADVYPEAKFVFVGDNGQADHFAAEMMAMPHAYKDGAAMLADGQYGFRSAATYRDQFLASAVCSELSARTHAQQRALLPALVLLSVASSLPAPMLSSELSCTHALCSELSSCCTHAL